MSFHGHDLYYLKEYLNGSKVNNNALYFLKEYLSGSIVNNNSIPMVMLCITSRNISMAQA